MTVKELLMIPAGVWRARKRERQEVLDGFGWIFENHYPFYKRIWWRYLFWAWCVVRRSLAIYAHLFRLSCVSAHSRLMDTITRGDRYQRFLEAREREIAALEEENRRRRGKFQRNLESSFTLHFEREARKYPHLTRSQSKHIN